MRITEPNEMLATQYAQIRPQQSPSAREQAADEARGAPAASGLLSVLDTDHDGWLDEDDIPYDHLVLRERELPTSWGDGGAGASWGDGAAGASWGDGAAGASRLDGAAGASRGDGAAGASSRDADAGVIYTRAAATPSPPPAREARAAQLDPKPQSDTRVAPQIDLLA